MELSNKIKFVISDFDGVFTDGSVYISERNEVQKKLNFKDIMAVSMLVKADINFGIISGERSNILDYFKDKFNLKEVYGGIRKKDEILSSIMKRYNLTSDEMLYIGDDINDIPAFNLVRYRFAPKNFNQVLLDKVENLQITTSFGGNGAVREIVDNLLEKVQ